MLGPDADVTLRWTFLAHHFRHDLDNWKRVDAQGGASLRVYGIQCIAVLAELGFSQVLSSRLGGQKAGESEIWEAQFARDDGARLTLYLDTRLDRQEFFITAKDGSPITRQSDPFEREPNPAGLDRRIAMLRGVYDTFSEDSRDWLCRYQRINRLWLAIEQKTDFGNFAAVRR